MPFLRLNWVCLLIVLIGGVCVSESQIPDSVEPRRISFAEFIILMALMMSLVALSIDVMLPALQVIGGSLGVAEAADVQLIISVMFLGLSLGQLAYGPASDSFGRRPAILLGYLVFIAGTVLSLLANDMPTMLAGRFLQGFGLSAPRILTVAIVRDLYAGREMARVMSFIMMIFVLVPMVAPLFGQTILWLADWRYIFAAVLLVGLVSMLWFYLRLAETHPVARRTPYAPAAIWRSVCMVAGNRLAMGYTLTAGIVSGAFIAYLGSSALIFQGLYGLGDRFPFYFALLAFAIGFSSFMNGRWVVQLGMRYLSWRAMWALFLSTGCGLIYSLLQAGLPPLLPVTLCFLVAFSAIGVLFGNLNALAMQDLGSIAGLGAAVVGALSTLIGVVIGMVIGSFYNQTLIPLLSGFVCCAGIGLLLLGRLHRNHPLDA